LAAWHHARTVYLAGCGDRMLAAAELISDSGDPDGVESVPIVL
jgi:hypothetical protein